MHTAQIHCRYTVPAQKTERKQIHGNTGTFLRSYQRGTTNYIERKPSKAKRVGTIAITIDPLNNEMFGHD